MSNKSLDACPRLIRNCRLSESAQQKDMLLMPEGVLQLRGSGAEIVRLCDGQRSVAQVIEQLHTKYPQTEAHQIHDEVLSFLNQMRSKRVMDF